MPAARFVIDRFRRRPFLVATNIFSAVILTPLFAVGDRAHLWIIYTVAALYGVSFIAVGGALNGLIKEVIPDELLGEAGGALQTVKQGLRLFAPLLGAGLSTAFGGGALAALGILGFSIAAVIIATLKASETPPQRSEQHRVAEVTAGVRHLFGQPGLRLTVLGTAPAIIVFGVGAVLVGLIDYRVLLLGMSILLTIAALWVLGGRRLSPAGAIRTEEPATVASGTAR